MIRVAAAVRSRSFDRALERVIAQSTTLSMVSMPAGHLAPPFSSLDADLVFIDLADWSHTHGARRSESEPAIIVVAEAPDRRVVASAVRTGAHGVLPYDVDVPQLAAAIEAVSRGLIVHPVESRAPVAPRRRGEQVGLTEREREVLSLVADGLPNHAIAAQLGISEHTVKTYVGAILEKLEAGTRAEAVAIGARRGLIAL